MKARMELRHEDTDELLLVAYDDEYDDGVPGLTIDTMRPDGCLMSLADVKRLHAFMTEWLERNRA